MDQARQGTREPASPEQQRADGGRQVANSYGQPTDEPSPMQTAAVASTQTLPAQTLPAQMVQAVAVQVGPAAGVHAAAADTATTQVAATQVGRDQPDGARSSEAKKRRRAKHRAKQLQQGQEDTAADTLSIACATEDETGRAVTYEGKLREAALREKALVQQLAAAQART